MNFAVGSTSSVVVCRELFACCCVRCAFGCGGVARERGSLSPYEAAARRRHAPPPSRLGGGVSDGSLSPLADGTGVSPCQNENIRFFGVIFATRSNFLLWVCYLCDFRLVWMHQNELCLVCSVVCVARECVARDRVIKLVKKTQKNTTQK